MRLVRESIARKPTGKGRAELPRAENMSRSGLLELGVDFGCQFSHGHSAGFVSTITCLLFLTDTLASL